MWEQFTIMEAKIQSNITLSSTLGGQKKYKVVSHCHQQGSNATNINKVAPPIACLIHKKIRGEATLSSQPRYPMEKRIHPLHWPPSPNHITMGENPTHGSY